jgi:hypothetical protein
MTDVAKQLEALATKKRRQYHQSTVEMVSKCGVQAEFRYVAGIRSRPKSFLMCGTATDKSVSTDLDCKISTGELEKEDVLLDVARDAIEHYPGKEELQPEDDEVGRSIEEIVASTKDKAVRLVKAHHGNIAPEIQPRQTARRFAINLDKWLRGRASEIHAQAEDAPTPWLKRALHQQARYLNVAARDGTDFVGEQDIVEEIDKQIIIRDTKTSKKSPSSDTAHESHQLSAYALASSVVDKQIPAALKLDYLVDLKGGTKTMTLSTTRDMQDIQKYLNRLVPVIASFESGIFLPASDNSWWCDARYCAYHDICQYVRHKETTIGRSDLVQIVGSQ